MRVNQITSMQAMKWYKSGWLLFAKAPLQWIAMFFLMLFIGAFLNMLPYNIGSLVFMILSPVLMAGIFTAMDKAEQGKNIALSDLFQVLQDEQRRGPLFLLGGLNFLFNTFYVVLFLSVIGGGEGLEAMMAGGEKADKVAQEAGIWVMMLLLPLLLVYMLAFLYAVPLIVFKHLSVKDALVWSLRASVSNFIPLLLAGIIYLILIMLSIQTYGLGFVLLIPVSFMVLYFGYKDLFNHQQSKDGSSTVVEF